MFTLDFLRSSALFALCVLKYCRLTVRQARLIVHWFMLIIGHLPKIDVVRIPVRPSQPLSQSPASKGFLLRFAAEDDWQELCAGNS